MRTGVAALLLLALAPLPAGAQTLPPEVIVERLLPTRAGPLVRSLTPNATRGIKVDGPLPPELDLPAIDLTITFEYDSARLTNDGLLTLRALGTALKDKRLEAMTFQVAGHTDSRGTEQYNQELSERRARIVCEHLAAFYGVAPERLVPVGYGKTRPIDANDLESGRNRRVQIINLAPIS